MTGPPQKRHKTDHEFEQFDRVDLWLNDLIEQAKLGRYSLCGQKEIQSMIVSVMIDEGVQASKPNMIEFLKLQKMAVGAVVIEDIKSPMAWQGNTRELFVNHMRGYEVVEKYKSQLQELAKLLDNVWMIRTTVIKLKYGGNVRTGNVKKRRMKKKGNIVKEEDAVMEDEETEEEDVDIGIDSLDLGSVDNGDNQSVSLGIINVNGSDLSGIDVLLGEVADVAIGGNTNSNNSHSGCSSDCVEIKKFLQEYGQIDSCCDLVAALCAKVREMKE